MHFPTSTLRSILLTLSLSTVVHSCGRFEHFSWWELPGRVWNATLALGYDFASWENPNYNPIEYVSFKDLLANKTIDTPVGIFHPLGPEALQALQDLDLVTGTCWDFRVNKYRGYTFADLQNSTNPFGDNLGDLVSILGWNETTWGWTLAQDNTTLFPIPDAACSPWLFLSPKEKFAAEGLGWTKDAWDSRPCDLRCAISSFCP